MQIRGHKKKLYFFILFILQRAWSRSKFKKNSFDVQNALFHILWSTKILFQTQDTELISLFFLIQTTSGHMYLLNIECRIKNTRLQTKFSDNYYMYRYCMPINDLAICLNIEKNVYFYRYIEHMCINKNITQACLHNKRYKLCILYNLYL